MKTSEIIKALRCTATGRDEDEPECDGCLYFAKSPVPDEEIGQVPEDFYYCCNSDLICMDAAKRLELLEDLPGLIDRFAGEVGV